jgi:hypothetical protein
MPGTYRQGTVSSPVPSSVFPTPAGAIRHARLQTADSGDIAGRTGKQNGDFAGFVRFKSQLDHSAIAESSG